MKIPTVLLREWADQPTTARVAQHAKQELSELQKGLMRACRSSQDGNVRQAVQKVDSADEFLKLLEGQHDKPSD